MLSERLRRFTMSAQLTDFGGCLIARVSGFVSLSFVRRATNSSFVLFDVASVPTTPKTKWSSSGKGPLCSVKVVLAVTPFFG